jgi:putative acetyltransferase
LGRRGKLPDPKAREPTPPETGYMLKIRDAVESDALAIYEVHREAVHITASKDYDQAILDEWSSNAVNRVDLLRAHILDNPDRTVMVVAELDGKVVGFGEIVPSKNELRAVYVSPSAGRQGVGKALLNEIESIARQHHVKFLWLDSSLTAAKFYADNGYQNDGDSEHELKTGRMMKCVKMSKKLIEPT